LGISDSTTGAGGDLEIHPSGIAQRNSVDPTGEPTLPLYKDGRAGFVKVRDSSCLPL